MTAAIKLAPADLPDDDVDEAPPHWLAKGTGSITQFRLPVTAYGQPCLDACPDYAARHAELGQQRFEAAARRAAAASALCQRHARLRVESAESAARLEAARAVLAECQTARQQAEREATGKALGRRLLEIDARVSVAEAEARQAEAEVARLAGLLDEALRAATAEMRQCSVDFRGQVLREHDALAADIQARIVARCSDLFDELGAVISVSNRLHQGEHIYTGVFLQAMRDLRPAETPAAE